MIISFDDSQLIDKILFIIIFNTYRVYCQIKLQDKKLEEI